MDMYEKIDTAAIGRVWGRVAPEAPGDLEERRSEDLRAALRGAMDRARAAEGMYSLLAGKTRGTGQSRELSALSREEAATGRQLQTEYFLLTGDTFAPAKSRPSAPYLMAALRDAHAAELESSRDYATLAAGLPDGKLRETLYDLSARERRHAQALRAMIARLMR